MLLAAVVGWDPLENPQSVPSKAQLEEFDGYFPVFKNRQTKKPYPVMRSHSSRTSFIYGTHSLRRTKASLIYRRTGNVRAVQILLGHTKLESTVRYLGIEVDDALSIAEKMDV